MKKFRLLALLSLTCLGFVSCHTVSGIGKDISSMGSAMSNSVENRYIGTPATAQDVYNPAY